jgi:hypothetical protein
MIPVLFFFFLQANTDAATLTREVAASGRVLEIGVMPSERATPPPLIAPGQPPLVSFRYFEGQTRHRFGNLDLVADDAGH